MTSDLRIREAKKSEFQAIGQLMVDVYSSLEGFPTQEEIPDYYDMLTNVGSVTEKPGTKLLIAVSADDEIYGAVVYFSNMQQYASGGDEIDIQHASGIRLLAVNHKARGQGVGNSLTHACIQIAKDKKHSQVILHSTRVMQVAWAMYEKIGFERFEDIDFEFHGFSIFGFRMTI